MTIEDLYKILLSDKPSTLIKENEVDIFNMIPELKNCKNFNQHNKWHIYDVYEHILHVVDEVGPELSLRLSALFHDIGKPTVYIEDKNKVGHFYNHWVVSAKIFDKFSEKYQLDASLKDEVKKLIFFHDANINKLEGDHLNEFNNSFNSPAMIKKLFNLKRADLKAQNPEYHYLLDEYTKLENDALKKYI